MGEFVRLEVADGVGTIRLDRPKMNALNVQVQEEIRAAAAEATERDDVKAVVVYGGERVFAAGADIKEMADMSYTDMVKRSGPLQSALTAVARIPKPVVAAITGYALGGGCELALCADVRFAADDAVLGQPEILLGIIPGAGGTQRLTRLVGPSKAKDIVFTGRFVKAEEALAIGLVDRLFPASSVYDEAMAWARQFAGAATYALRAAKESIDRGLEVDLETGLEIERQQFAALFATEDRTTGMRSFVENGPGKAQFEGR
ncbi:enoyl-CoA hydratase-related protein [Nocardioides sp.]|uniref:enoyl-CoA hydratase/isomerase family protein n=1 Tax=Nocardioides sp. TaxID=35761 RepID=UPI0025F6DA71|nr:enoyl-CoA hydratase-related protein [Nocardioides sp.]